MIEVVLACRETTPGRHGSAPPDCSTLTDRDTVAAYAIGNTTNSGPNYTTSRDVTGGND